MTYIKDSFKAKLGAAFQIGDIDCLNARHAAHRVKEDLPRQLAQREEDLKKEENREYKNPTYIANLKKIIAELRSSIERHKGR